MDIVLQISNLMKRRRKK